MKKRVLLGVTILFGTLTVLMSFLLLNYSNFHVLAQQRQVELVARTSDSYSVLDLLRDETEIVESAGTTEQMKGQLRLELPDGVSASDIVLTESAIDQTVEVMIPHINENYFYDYPMIGSSDHIVDIKFDGDTDTGYIEITLDNVYELELLSDDAYVYLNFVDPHEIYDFIVVVDAGHGGAAVGATKQGITEKEIDLAIVQQLKLLLDDNTANIGVYYTRLDDSNPSLESRVALANMLDADLFLSIHNNSTASGRMSSINGTSVLYHVTDETGESKRFAEICLEQLLATLGSSSKGVIAGDTIYIVREATMPVALVEVGFMTNQEELDRLNSADYQAACAQALYNSILQALEEFDEN